MKEGPTTFPILSNEIISRLLYEFGKLWIDKCMLWMQFTFEQSDVGLQYPCTCRPVVKKPVFKEIMILYLFF